MQLHPSFRLILQGESFSVLGRSEKIWLPKSGNDATALVAPFKSILVATPGIPAGLFTRHLDFGALSDIRGRLMTTDAPYV